MANKTIYSCDICKKEAKTMSKGMQVIFTTDQTEGRSTKPYLEVDIMDICDSCMERVLSGEPIWAHGAQGHNTYYFKGDQ